LFSHVTSFQNAAVASGAGGFHCFFFLGRDWVFRSGIRHQNGATLPQVQAFANTPIITYLYPAKSLIL
jgi:hypothetical protein